MNTERLAALYVRFSGLVFLINAGMYATQLPYEIANVQVARSKGIAHSVADVALQGLWTRILLELIVGLMFLIGWRQMIHLLTAGISLVKKNEEQL